MMMGEFEEYPSSQALAEAYIQAGIQHWERHAPLMAVACLHRALAIQPGDTRGLTLLGHALFRAHRMAEAGQVFQQALEVDPACHPARRGFAQALLRLGDPGRAVQVCRQVVADCPDDAQAHVELGWVLLLTGQWAEGWREFGWRLRLPGTDWPADRPMWDGSSLAGRSMLLVAEQGLGDTIQFVRYAASLKLAGAGQVCFLAPKCLHPLLATCAGVDALVGPGEEVPVTDVWCPLMHVPALLGERLDGPPGRRPYLRADRRLRRFWRRRLAELDGVRVGIHWQGNPAMAFDWERSCPLAEWAPLGQLDGVRLISLQRQDGAEQLDHWGGVWDILPLGQELDTGTAAFLDTAAVVSNLDLLISTDSAVGHLAGALGVRTWMVLPAVSDWRWQWAGEDTAWYRSVRLFRQPAPGEWGPVFQQVAGELCRVYPAVTRRRPRHFRVADCGPHRLARTRHGLMLYHRADRYIGRSLDLYGEYSPVEADFLRQLVEPGMTVVDAGANIGAFTLMLAERVGAAGRVVAFEPVPELYRLLCANVGLNGRSNVDCRNVALGDRTGWVDVPTLDGWRDENFGGVELDRPQAGRRVPLVGLDSLRLEGCHLLKADVEGMEAAVVRGAAETIRRCRPVLYLENDRLERSAELIETVAAMGYALYWHLPPLFWPDNHYGQSADRFRGLVSVNMLGWPAELTGISIQGLRRVAGPDDTWDRNLRRRGRATGR